MNESEKTMQIENKSAFYLARFGDYDRFLNLFNKKNINQLSDDGYSLLHLSITGNNDSIADFLIENGIDVNLQDKSGSTALHYACERHNVMLCKKLLLAKCDVNIRDCYGNNALWTAVINCKQKHYYIVELLMLYLPDAITKNNAKRSPTDLAKQINDEHLLRILNTSHYRNVTNSSDLCADEICTYACIITKSLFKGETTLKWFFREKSINNKSDSGWRAFGLSDTQDYIDNNDNHLVVSINTLIDIEPAILSVVDFPIGSDLEFHNDGGKKYFTDNITGEIIK